MSSPNDPNAPIHDAEPVDDLMITDEPHDARERDRVSSSVRDIASRIPESLSSIGRDISRTIERAIAAKDDYVVAVKVSRPGKRRRPRWRDTASGRPLCAPSGRRDHEKSRARAP